MFKDSLSQPLELLEGWIDFYTFGHGGFEHLTDVEINLARDEGEFHSFSRPLAWLAGYLSHRLGCA